MAVLVVYVTLDSSTTRGLFKFTSVWHVGSKTRQPVPTLVKVGMLVGEEVGAVGMADGSMVG
jgi:hypothetical protein